MGWRLPGRVRGGVIRAGSFGYVHGYVQEHVYVGLAVTWASERGCNLG